MPKDGAPGTVSQELPKQWQLHHLPLVHGHVRRSGAPLKFQATDQYMLLQGMLVTASRYGGSDYSYNTVTVVLLTESVKLVLSSAVYVKDKTAASLGEVILKNKKVDHDNHGHGD